MSLTATGYVRETIDEIFIRMSNDLKKTFPTININPDNIIYQWLKTTAVEKYYLQGNIDDGMQNITPMAAEGVWLDKHGQERGLTRKKPSYAVGEVLCSGVPDNSSIPEGSLFATENNKTYVSTEARYFADKLIFTRLGGTQDDIPANYANLSISGLFTDPDYNTLISTGYYTFSGDIVTWSNTGFIASGEYYYVSLSGTMAVYVPIQCDTSGTYGNTASNTITVNASSLGNITSCYNVADITNGREWETDNDYRQRILAANGKTFSLKSVEAMVWNLAGVKNCSVWQTSTVDRAVPTDWTYVLDSGIALNGTGWYGLSFYPSSGIGTLSSVTLYGRTSGIAPDLDYGLKQYVSGQISPTGTYLASGSITMEILEREHEDLWQEIEIPIKYNGLDTTRTYAFYFHQAEEPTSGYWMFATTGEIAVNYRSDSFSGFATFSPSGFVRKTGFKAPAYNIEVIPYSNYIFATDIKPEIEALLDNESGGYSPVCIQYNILEAEKVYLGTRGKLTLYPNYTLATVIGEAKYNLAAYLDTLNVGEDVVYSQAEKAIMNTPGVKKLTNFQICINNGTWITRNEERDLAVSNHEYVVLDTSTLYQGAQLT